MRVSKQILALATLAIFGTIALFGLSAGMMNDTHGTMANCPFMKSASSLCQMNVFEHITIWQSLFAAALPPIIVLLLVFTFLFVGFSLRNFNTIISSKGRYLAHRRQKFIIGLFDYLRRAFKKGILHAKVFAFSPLS